MTAKAARLVVRLLLLSPAACAGMIADPGTPIVIGTSHVLHSAVLGQDRTWNVWLPPSYGEGDRRYPVVFVLDGGIEQDFHHISGLGQLATIVGQFDDVIVVGVETVDRRAELTPPSRDPGEIHDFPTHGHSAAFRAFLCDELVPEVRRRYRCAGDDVLMGESFAGLFTVETLLERPAAFAHFVAISPSLWWNQGALGARVAAALAAAKPRPKELYLAIADEPGAMREGVLAIAAAARARDPGATSFRFRDRSDLTHATIYHREALEALCWLFAHEGGGR